MTIAVKARRLLTGYDTAPLKDQVVLVDGDHIGTVEPGKMADLIFVAGDPIQDLETLRQPKLVMLEGRIVVDRR